MDKIGAKESRSAGGSNLKCDVHISPMSKDGGSHWAISNERHQLWLNSEYVLSVNRIF